MSIEPTDRRARNRQSLADAAHRFLFYFATFSALYLSVTLPPLFKAMFIKGPVLLSDARLIGHALPAIPIDKNYIQFALFAIAAFLYLPLLALAELVTSLIAPVINLLFPVTERVLSATTMLGFLVFCIPTAATSIWLFFERSFQDSLFLVIVALFVAFAFAQSQSSKR